MLAKVANVKRKRENVFLGGIGGVIWKRGREEIGAREGVSFRAGRGR